MRNSALLFVLDDGSPGVASVVDGRATLELLAEREGK